MNAEYYSKIIEALIELIDEGVYIVDQDGVGQYYNKAMASMEKVNMDDVLGKKFHEAFPDFRMGESTMFRALTKKEPTLKKQQTYKNLYGKEITTINSTIPIVVDGEAVAAVEVAKDITNIRKMSDTLLELQEVKRERSEQNVPIVQSGIRRYTFDDIYGENEKFKAAVNRAKRAAGNDASVFIYGETGTGKELFAQSIHYGGPRKERPFWHKTVRRFRRLCWKGFCSARQRAASPEQLTEPGCLNRQTEEPCCSTKSVPCLMNCKASFCVSCRRIT